MVVKITSKWELRRLCGVVNATALVRLGPATPDEMGSVDLVEVSHTILLLLVVVVIVVVVVVVVVVALVVGQSFDQC